jgi:uncharacterized membrane protein YbhN (UPF0104 family)
MGNFFARLHGNRRLYGTLQVVALGILLGFLAYAFRGTWADAEPRLRSASLIDLGIAAAILAAYYLLFVAGWMRILAAYGIRVPYRIALQAEMLSMLAKYVPGGVWTPAARVVAMRRAGVTDTPKVLASVLLEAGLSAVSGVLVFLASLSAVNDVNTSLLPLLGFAALLSVLLQPRVFRPLARRVLRPFGASEVPALPYRTMLYLLVYYSFTWLVGGAALYFLIRSVGDDPGVAAIPFLGGVSAVGAIVAVLSIIAPSGLGVREASMYGLMLAVTSSGAALGATVLNRVTITVVEAGLLLVGMLAWRLRMADVKAPDLSEGEAHART